MRSLIISVTGSTKRVESANQHPAALFPLGIGRTQGACEHCVPFQFGLCNLSFDFPVACPFTCIAPEQHVLACEKRWGRPSPGQPQAVCWLPQGDPQLSDAQGSTLPQGRCSVRQKASPHAPMRAEGHRNSPNKRSMGCNISGKTPISPKRFPVTKIFNISQH